MNLKKEIFNNKLRKKTEKKVDKILIKELVTTYQNVDKFLLAKIV